MSCLYLMWSSLWCFCSLSPFSLIICALFIQTTSYPSYFRFSALNRCTFPCVLWWLHWVCLDIDIGGMRIDSHRLTYVCLRYSRHFFGTSNHSLVLGMKLYVASFWDTIRIQVTVGHHHHTVSHPSLYLYIYIYIYIYIEREIYIYTSILIIYIYIYLPCSPRMVNFDDKTDIMLLG